MKKKETDLSENRYNCRVFFQKRRVIWNRLNVLIAVNILQ